MGSSEYESDQDVNTRRVKQGHRKTRVKREKPNKTTDAPQLQKNESKKRQRSVKDSNDSDKEEDEDEDSDSKTSHKKAQASHKGSWPEEQSELLKKLISEATAGKENAKVPWSNIIKDFQEAFPTANKSVNALQLYYRKNLKNGDIDLTDEEISKFKQAVTDIKGPEMMAAIAWRFHLLGGRQLNKGAAAKLYKQYF